MKCYCEKCETHVEMIDAKEVAPEERDDLKEVTIEENKKLFQGKCPDCGQAIYYQAIISTEI